MANASIFQSLLRPVKSVAEYDADYDAAEGNKLKLAAARMGMEQTQRGAQQAEARRQAFAASGGDRKAYRNALQRIGDFAGVQELDAADLKSRETEADITLKGSQAKKADSDIEAKKFEMAEKRINIMGQSSKYLMDNPTLGGAMQVTQYLMDNGVIDQGMAQKTIAELQANPTPEYIRQRAEQAFRTALGAKEQLEARMAQNRGGTAAVVGVDPVTGKARDVQSAEITQSADNKASNARQAADAAAGRAVTMLGLKLADARAREGTWTLSSDTGNLVNSRTGAMKPATGPDGKPQNRPVKLTELQGKATGFSARMQDAEKTLSTVEDDVWPSQSAMAGYKTDMPKWLPGGQIIGGALTAANKTLNPMVTEKAMKYRQAQENWVTANLRLESGAVIQPEEMQLEIEKWFPQPGEPKSVRDQKKAARAVAQRSVKAQAGPGQDLIDGIVSPQQAKDAAPDASDPLGLRR